MRAVLQKHSPGVLLGCVGLVVEIRRPCARLRTLGFLKLKYLFGDDHFELVHPRKVREFAVFLTVEYLFAVEIDLETPTV